ncbi:TetR/AcrR family transcriptional regulator [Sphingobium sp. Z007]|uniref:TetR/AcrR family transcriptional regulator n=1 Tax=Sphingobium sp. Z007 TaxID=627495 RepID=UPI0015958676|nr:TetR/AcrR family transcriptional regulator [Sphingobium sp. Z007]
MADAQAANAPPRRRDREASRRALLDAGIALFSQQGYDAATTRAIAARAGLNEQLITRYFGGKAGLLAAVYAHLLEQRDNDAAYAALPLADSASEEIGRFLHWKHEHLHAIAALLQIVVPQLVRDPALAPGFDNSITQRGAVILADRLDALKAMGKVRADADTARVAQLVIWQSLALSFLMRRFAGDRDREILLLIDIFAQEMGAGLATG